VRTVTCERFADSAEDLALGHATEPERAALLDHAASCADCGSLLRDLSATVDRLLELAPDVEPPVGFETRAVAAMRDRRGPAATARRSRRLVVCVAAACIAAGVLAGVGISRLVGEPTRARDTVIAAVIAADVVTPDGSSLGVAEIHREPRARVLVVLDGPHTWRGKWSCDLRRADGSWTTVGTWAADEAPTGAWTTAITSELTASTAMRIRAADGTVIATADFA